MLLELSLLPVPSLEAFLQQVGPAFQAYGNGDHEDALATFLSAVGGTDWASVRAVLDERLPGAVAQAIKDADTFFGVELAGLTVWAFGPEQAAAIHCPVLSVVGTHTQPVWVETADFLRTSLPHVEETGSRASATCCTSRIPSLSHWQWPSPGAQPDHPTVTPKSQGVPVRGAVWECPELCVSGVI